MKPSSNNDHGKTQLARYQILVQHREYIDRLFWSRVQILHLIQAGVLGGSFYLKAQKYDPIIYLGILVIGIALTFMLLIIARNDRNDAVVNNANMYKLGDTLGIRWGTKRWKICGHEIKSNKILYLIFYLFILVDLLLLYFFNLQWGIAVTLTLILLIILTLITRWRKLLSKE